jgi:hypothetical protein
MIDKLKNLFDNYTGGITNPPILFLHNGTLYDKDPTHKVLNFERQNRKFLQNKDIKRLAKNP